jgi:DNA polymerase-3 subunit epsilon
MVPRSLAATCKYYCDKDYKQQHTASIDVEVAIEILIKQLEKYNEIRDRDFINRIHEASPDLYVDSSRKFYWKHGKAYFAFSKYRDIALAEVAKLHPKFLQWILKADFSDETKSVVKKALEEAKKEQTDKK